MTKTAVANSRIDIFFQFLTCYFITSSFLRSNVMKTKRKWILKNGKCEKELWWAVSNIRLVNLVATALPNFILKQEKLLWNSICNLTSSKSKKKTLKTQYINRARIFAHIMYCVTNKYENILMNLDLFTFHLKFVELKVKQLGNKIQ